MGKQKSKQGEKRDILDTDTLQYYRRISRELQQDFDDKESKALLLQNIFRQLSTEAVRASQSPAVSYVIEELVRLADRCQLITLLEQFFTDWETVCCDRFASHVIQAAVKRCGDFLHEAKNDSTTAVVEECKTDGGRKADKRKQLNGGRNSAASKHERDSLLELFDSLCEFLRQSLSLYMQHVYASHVMRAVLQVLSAQPADDAIIHGRRHGVGQRRQCSCSNSEQTGASIAASDICLNKLNEFALHIVSLKKLSDHVTHSTSNPVLQTILVASQSLNTAHRDVIFTQLANSAQLFHTADDQTLPHSVTHDIASYLVQQYVTLCSESLLDAVWDSCFSRHIVEMARHRVANFILQTVITRIHTKQQLEVTCAALNGEFEQLFALNHIGVLVHLADACHRLAARQKHFIKNVLKALHCYKPSERQSKVIHLLASMCTYEILFNVPETTDPSTEHNEKDVVDTSQGKTGEPVVSSFNLHGSLLVQSMLRFNRPDVIVDSLMSLSATELQAVCCDSAGSHVITAFVNSPTVTQRSQLYAKLKPVYSGIACDKRGSRAFDSLWDAASLEQRQLIATALSSRAAALRSNQFGSFIYDRCGLRCFADRPHEWKQLQSSQTRKRRLLDHLKDDSSADVPQKLVKKSKHN